MIFFFLYILSFCFPHLSPRPHHPFNVYDQYHRVNQLSLYQVYTLNSRLKMSNEETKIAMFILQHRTDPIGSPPLRYCMDLHNDTVAREPKIKDRIKELLKYRGEEKLLKEFQNWSPQRFPITGYDLFSKNVPKGPVFSKTLNELRRMWKESNYQMSKEELVDRIEDVVKRNSANAN